MVEVPAAAAAKPAESTCSSHWGRIFSKHVNSGEHKDDIHYRWASSMSCTQPHEQWGSGLVIRNSTGGIWDQDAEDESARYVSNVLEFKSDFYASSRHKFHIHSNFYVVATPGYVWSKTEPPVALPNGASRNCFLSDPTILHCITNSATVK